jgi:hypothetical protein
VRGKALTVRSIALLAAASAAVHELRYLLAYGSDTTRALAAHPHGYLSVALPGVITATLIAVAAVLMRTARGSRRAPVTRRASFGLLWLGCTVALASIYGVQETLEGAGAVAGSGWIGLALALPAGLLVALAMRGADAAEALRAPGAALRAFAIVADIFSGRAMAPHARLAARLVRVRGPPQPFVV